MKPGYKQTEIGVIPENWEVETLGNIASVKTGPFGSALHAEDYALSGTPILTVEHLGEYRITRQNLPRVSDTDRKRLSSYQLQRGDIVFSRVGSVDRNAYVSEAEDGWLFSGRLLRIRLNDCRCNAKYLSFYFKDASVKSRVREIAVGQTMPSLNTRLLSSCSICIPTQIEQKRIAESLSDMDELIASLEKLIAKKKAIKQGAMQELLTGKRRLPGFSGEWYVASINDIAEFHTATIPTEVIEIKHYIGTDNMISNKGGIRDNEIGIPYSAVREYKINNILLSNIRPYLKKIWLADKHGGCSNDVLVIRTKNKEMCVPAFLYYCLCQDRFFDEVMANAVGTKMPRGDKGVIMGYYIHIPRETAEQTAIVATLKDIDVSIEMLVSRLAKACQIKQGMMQKLLTGKIRLV